MGCDYLEVGTGTMLCATLTPRRVDGRYLWIDFQLFSSGDFFFVSFNLIDASTHEKRITFFVHYWDLGQIGNTPVPYNLIDSV